MYLQTGVSLVKNLTGISANGTYYYSDVINNHDISKIKQISTSASNLYKNIWVYATLWGGASVSISTCCDEIVLTDVESSVFILEKDETGATNWTANSKWALWQQGNLWWRVVINNATATTKNLNVKLIFGI